MWEHSNQVAFERIHDVWRGRAFAHTVGDGDGNGRSGRYTPDEIVEQIEATVLGKLRATDSVVRRLKQDHRAARRAGPRPSAACDWRDARGTLLLRKGPFRLYTDFDPTDFSDPEALQTFALLEAALAELQTRALHTLKPDERAAKFEAIRGLRYLPGLDEDEKTVHAGKPEERTYAQALWFAFDPASRDAKFSEGEDYLVVTPEDEPDALLKSVDGPLFAEFVGCRGRNYKVAIDRFDLLATRRAARPPPPARAREVPRGPRPRRPPRRARSSSTARTPTRSPSGSSARSPGSATRRPSEVRRTADAARSLLATGTVAGWSPSSGHPPAPEHALRKRMRGRERGGGRDAATA